MKHLIFIIAGILVVALPTVAFATMPLLTREPETRTSDSCKKWAAEQDEDAIDMWGIKENGQSSKEIALERLVNNCLGFGKPEIVGFGSSVGYSEMYCRKHRKSKICEKVQFSPTHQ